jgi:pyrimidine-nucleoside phosphorylase
MNDIIIKKRDGHALSEQEIQYVVKGFTSGEIPDYQMSALLMAIYFNHMNYEETLELTLAMADSGDRLDLSGISGVKVDKHSTGGVGDKTTLVLAPMVAALGIKTAKMSGRGLGHTGGTIDKLESIPGFSTSLTEQEFIDNASNIGLALTGQTGNITPADKKIYALRDVTGTVENMSLIASSIMSKKLAAGADVIVLDVKAGSGAFMKTVDDACGLADMMVKIGNGAGRKTCAVISQMNEPLGRAVGNGIEVIEAVQTLKGEGEEDLLELCLELGSLMVTGADSSISKAEARKLLMETVTDGRAYAKFREFVAAQGGNLDYIDNCDKLVNVKEKLEIKSEKTGYVKSINTYDVGRAVMLLGGGREKKGDDIDHNVGVLINKKVGDYVEAGESIAAMYINDGTNKAQAAEMLKNAYEYSGEPVEKLKLVQRVIE